MKRFLIIFFAFSLSASTSVADTPPDLGDATLGVITKFEEEKLGRDFMRGARQSLRFLDDPLLVQYVSDLGFSILAHADAGEQAFRFYLIDRGELNAFAVPGGHIAFYTGLILATESESELASVMAHEVAHITQRHLPRQIARAKQRSLPAAAAIIAGVLLGGQLGAAALATTNAAVISDQLSYSRDFEREADAIGMRSLADAGYDPLAMPKFFGRLEQQSRTQINDVPEFLRTHPLSTSRIAESESRAAAYPRPPVSEDLDFHHVRARIVAKAGDDPGRAIRRFESILDQDQSAAMERAARYGLAVALSENREYDRGLELIEALLDSHGDYPFYLAARGEILLAAGRYPEAVSHLKEAVTLQPENGPLALYLSDALVRTGQPKEARKFIRRQLRRDPNNPHLYRLLARAEGELGARAQSFQALAEYFYLLDDYERALAQLGTAEGFVGDSYYLRASIDARKQEIQNELQRYED